jgi:hypothetical protein
LRSDSGQWASNDTLRIANCYATAHKSKIYAKYN